MVDHRGLQTVGHRHDDEPPLGAGGHLGDQLRLGPRIRRLLHTAHVAQALVDQEHRRLHHSGHVHLDGIRVELLRRSGVYEMAHPEYVDLVGPGVGQVHVVRGDDHRRPGVMQLLGELHELEGHLRVESGSGLVHHQDLRVHGQCSGEGQPLPLAVGQLHRVPVPEIVQSHEAERPVNPA